MSLYLYRFLELFSIIGDGTPENPGGDFGMSVWIDADDMIQARNWGKRVLEEFVRERFRQSDPDLDPSRYEGDIVEDAVYEVGRTPLCKVGEIPSWPEPWKHDRASGPPRRVSLRRLE
jgi:hypothetical protein